MCINYRLLNKDDANYLEVIDLYKEAFPEAQRIPKWFLKFKLRNGKSGFNILYAHDEWVGLIYTIEYRDILFIQFIAISKSHRSKGFGSKVLDSLKEIHSGKRIALNIEVIDEQASNYQQRLRRKGFYEKNGFLSSGFNVKEPGEDLEMLIFGGTIEKEEIESMYKKLFGNTLGFFIKPKITKI